MNRFWEHILAPVADALEPRYLVEVGVAGGALTAKLLDWAAAHEAVVHSIDPAPALDIAEWQRQHGDRWTFHQARSLNVLGRLGPVDIAFIDGDHNWFTLIHELRLLERTALERDSVPPVVAVHDIGWPYGRRDLYYEPDSIPPAHRQPFERKGILPGEGELSDRGLNGHLQNAIYEHSIANGLRTAVEDFVAESNLRWKLFEVPGLSGLGVLVTDEHLIASPKLAAVLESLSSADFLRLWAGELELARVYAEIALANLSQETANDHAKLSEIERERSELTRAVEDHRAALDRAASEREQLHRDDQSARELSRQEHEAALQAERAAHAQAREAHDQLVADRDQLVADRDQLAAERDQLAGERDRLVAERDRSDGELAEEVKRSRQARDQLATEIERLEGQATDSAAMEAELRRDLAAARTAAEEADALRRAVETGAGSANGEAPASATAAIWVSLGAALTACHTDMSASVAERDPMFTGQSEGYLAVSRSALRAVIPALALAGIAKPESILDLPSGFGRVTRALRAAWPDAELVAADQSTSAVAFCVEQFSAEGWVVPDYLRLEDDPRHRGRYDLIWSASLLSAIDPELIDGCLSALLSMLRENGVLVTAYHGRDSARRFSEQPDQGLRTLAQSFAKSGVGFRSRDGSESFGVAAMAPHWLLPHLTRHRNAMVLGVTERGWADHLDVVAITRRDIHHRQVDPATLT